MKQRSPISEEALLAVDDVFEVAAWFLISGVELSTEVSVLRFTSPTPCSRL
jgi:hypothetical protein